MTGWTCALSGGSRVLTCISTAAPIAAGAPLAPVTVAVRISSGTSGDLQTAVALSDSADHATTATTAATVDVTVDPVLHVGASGRRRMPPLGRLRPQPELLDRVPRGPGLQRPDPLRHPAGG